MSGQTAILGSGKKPNVEIVAPAEASEGLKNKDGVSCAGEESGTLEVLKSGKKPVVDIIAPKGEKDEIKKIAAELESAVLSYAVEAEKVAGIKVNILEDSIMYKAASALKGALNIVEELEKDAKLATIARDFLDHNLSDNYSDSITIIKKAHSKFEGDFSAVETWVKNQKLASSLSMSLGESEEVSRENTAYEKYENYLRG